jgi:glycosyltransferase involved in cell wall biosynthesis
VKVCLIVSTFEPDTIGGQGEVVLKLQKQLLEHSVEAYVLTSGLNISGYPCTVRTGSGKRLFYVASAAYLNWIRKMKFDIINVHLESGMSLVPFLIATKCPAKIVATLHDSYLSEWRSIGRLTTFKKGTASPTVDEYVMKYLLTPVKFLGTYIDCALADRIIAVSARTRDECKTEYRIPAEKMSVIHNGVDLEEFNPQIDRTRIRNRLSLGNQPIILTVGASTIRKGIPYLLRSMASVAGKIRDAKLIVVGSMKYRRQMELLTNELGIQHNVIFPEQVERAELPFYYSACDVVAVPSISEGFPMVVLEAMASGKPVVASRVGGIPEAIQTGINGILFEPGNIPQMTHALLRLLEDDLLRKRMCLNARQIAESRYDWKQVALQYLSEFNRLLQLT